MILLLLLIILVTSTITSCNSCGGDFSSSKEEGIYLPPIDSSIIQRADTFFVKQPLPSGQVGLMIYDVTADQEVYSYNKDSLMKPASCMKLLTCIAALHYFGAEKKFHDRLYISGNQKADTLQGDLILKTNFNTAFNRDTLNMMIDSLKSYGINAISGNIIVDMAFIEPMNHEEHWIIGDLHTRYMGLVLQGGNRMKREISAALTNRKISFNPHKVNLGRLNPAKSKLFYDNYTTAHYSIEKALKLSSNINAEALLFPLGYIINKEGNYRETGKKTLDYFIRTQLHKETVNVCNIDDGCGLCPNDKMSPQLLIDLLVYAAHREKIYKEIIQDLPLAGIDGTLYKRMHHPSIEGKIRAKTGTLTRDGGVATLAGYFFGKDRHLIAFTIMNNGCGVEIARQWQDRFCKDVLCPTDSI